MSLYLSNHWLIADQRFRFGFAVALPCVVLVLAWRTIASKDPSQKPPTIEKSPNETEQSRTNSVNNKPTTTAPATNTKVTLRAPYPISTANKPTQAPAVPPKAEIRAPRYRRAVPEKKAEASVVQVKEERPATPETPTSKPKRKSTTTAGPITPLLAEDHYHHHQQHHQHSSPAPLQEPDAASIGSGGSSEHQPSSSSSSNYKNRTLRVGKNLKRAWSKRPFAGNGPAAAPAHGGESILFPESLGSSSPSNSAAATVNLSR
jgi:hypothetical protein